MTLKDPLANFVCDCGHPFPRSLQGAGTMGRKVFPMRPQRARRLAAASAAGLLMAGGVAVGTASTASASSQSYSHSQRCDNDNWWGNDCDGYGRGGHHDYDKHDYDRGGHHDYDNHDYDRGGHHGNDNHDHGRGGDHDNGRGGDHDNDRGGYGHH